MHVVLIPSYEPDARLLAVVTELQRVDASRPIVVVDDGSGPGFGAVFAAVAASGCDVLIHSRNRGKGAALKTGMRHIIDAYPDAHVITADADGQHSPDDIARVARRLDRVAARTRPASVIERDGGPAALVLGTRTFTAEAAGGPVPLRSRVGNGLSRLAFRAMSGQAIGDTQTGLRGLPAHALPWLLTVPGERFDYEFRVLLQARGAGVALAEEPIRTIYSDGNSSSHFRPIADSLRIYAPVLCFGASALLAFAVDTVALLALFAVTGWMLFSVVAARLVSGTLNFAVNRRLVFRRGREVPGRTAAVRYLSLAALLLAANFGVITALTGIGIPLIVAKLLTEATLFVVSFSVQRSVVFAPIRE